MVIAHIHVDSVVSISTLDAFLEWESHYFRMLTQVPDVGLVACESCTVDAALLSCTDTDGLTVLDVAHRVRLGIFERDKSNHEVATSCIRNLLIGSRDVLEKSIVVKIDLVASLFKGNTEDHLALYWSWLVFRIDLDYAISTLALCLKHCESLWLKTWSDDTVAHLTVDELGCSEVAHIAQCDEVAKRRHTISTTGTNVCTSEGREFVIIDKIDLLESVVQRQTHGSTSRRYMLERSSSTKASSFLQLLDKLPAVECIEKVDVARTAVEHNDREFSIALHEDARWLLIRITTVLKFEFFHYYVFCGKIASFDILIRATKLIFFCEFHK